MAVKDDLKKKNTNALINSLTKVMTDKEDRKVTFEEKFNSLYTSCKHKTF